MAALDLEGLPDHGAVVTLFRAAVAAFAASHGANATAIDMAANNQNDV